MTQAITAATQKRERTVFEVYGLLSAARTSDVRRGSLFLGNPQRVKQTVAEYGGCLQHPAVVSRSDRTAVKPNSRRYNKYPTREERQIRAGPELKIEATRRSITAFAGAILVSIVTRLPSAFQIPESDVVIYSGMLVGGALWSLGFYYGYEATRSERAT